MSTEEPKEPRSSLFENNPLAESIPFAFFSIDLTYHIVGANSRFERMFPGFSKGDLCYKTLGCSESDGPCEECIFRKAVMGKEEFSRESKAVRGDETVYYRLTASPIIGSDDQIIGATEYIEDITHRVTAEMRLSEYSRRMESRSAVSSESLKRTEHEFSLMANSFHEINMAKDSSALVLEIVNSFIKFRALPVFYAPFDSTTSTILSLSMHPSNYEIEKITGDTGAIVVNEHNPFLIAAKNRNFMIYHGRNEVTMFIKTAFPGKSESFVGAMMDVLADSSILVLPLHTEGGTEAVVGLAVSPVHLMEHFDTYRYIANYSAMSLSKQNSALRLTQAQKMTIMSLVKLVEYRDVETGSHLERMMRYTEILAHDLSQQKRFRDYITDVYISDIVNSCLLHDIGKVGIPDSILKKPGKLTPDEFEIMKKHTLYGGDSLSEAEKKVQGRSFLNLSKEIAYYHHEWYNGKGYPFGVKGDAIPLSARIVAVADVYDALRSKRSYKDEMSHEEATRIIVAESGTHFDSNIVDAFIRQDTLFLEHSMVQ
jgi:PAS domain S-box-containing protein